MSSENFYTILGVSEKATQDEIKKAYRKKAIESHPDKGGSEEEFKKISEAYDNLGDENKRKDYDNKRNNPFANFGGNPFEDFFSNQFSGQRKRTVPDKIIEINIGAVESYNGVDKTITYQRKHSCNGCNGTGGEKIVCKTCNGTGANEIRIGTGLFVQIVRQPCRSCNGQGSFFKTKCFTCNGESTINSVDNITIKLPKGVDNGQFLKLQGNGDYHQSMYGNLIIKINLIPENNFEKSGNDLIYNSFLTLKDLQKDTIDIPHPDGMLNIKLPNEFDTSKPLRVKSKGYLGDGDMYVKLFVKIKRNP
jgi:molecular chaperone DnaJ